MPKYPIITESQTFPREWFLANFPEVLTTKRKSNSITTGVLKNLMQNSVALLIHHQRKVKKQALMTDTKGAVTANKISAARL